MEPNDKSTWHTERINMPSHTSFRVSEFAPKAWAAICELVGGEERISESNHYWHDSFIVNLGTSTGAGQDIGGRQLQGWHVDGDFFVHYLDSPEQGLLVIPLFTDIVEGGGGTMICPDAIPIMARHLFDNPEGVSPYMVPRRDDPDMNREQSLDFFNNIASTMADDAFVEVTGCVGDVYLLHPLMLHSASNNKLRQLRIISNPPISLEEPFNFDRNDCSQYSIVERKTISAIGQDKLQGWKITNTRDRIVPAREKAQEEMKKEELRRLEHVQTSTVLPVVTTQDRD